MKKNRLLLFLSFVGLVSAFALASPTSLASVHAEETILGQTIEDTYVIGDVLTIHKSIRIVQDGQEREVTSATLIEPDGTAIRGMKFTLNQLGSYRLLLASDTAQGNYFVTKSFTVKKTVYGFGNADSSIDYGALNSNFQNLGMNQGLLLSMVDGDTFTYASPINLYKQDEISLLSWNVMVYEPMVKFVTVRLTDCYDSTNYLDITYSKGDYYFETNITLSQNGSRGVGLMPNERGAVDIDGESYEISTIGGTKIDGNNPINGAYYNITYRLDTSDHNHLKIYADTAGIVASHLVGETNNSHLFQQTMKPFTTGEVFLSLKASNFNGVEKAPIQIGQIAGRQNGDLLPMDYYSDTLAPVIDVDAPKKAEVVLGVPVRLPIASAKDDTAVAGEVETALYYNLGSNTERRIPLEEGKFTPTEYGIYTLRYRAKDVYGNVGIEDLTLVCETKGREGIVFQADPLPTQEAGSTIDFSHYTCDSLNGKAKVNVTITDPKGQKITLSSLSEPYLLSVVGRYIVTYSYSDAFYSGAYSYSFMVKKNEHPKIALTSLPSAPYYLKGANYSLEPVMAVSYSETGPNCEETDAFVSYDNGAFSHVNPHSFTITEGKTIRFRFVAKSDASVAFESDSYPIVDVNYNGVLNLPAYFQGDFKGTTEIDHLAYQPNTNGSSSLTFVNRLLFSSFDFRFFFPSGLARSMKVILSDYFNPNDTFTMELLEDDTYRLNDGIAYRLSDGWRDRRFSLSYLSDAHSLSIGNTIIPCENPFSHDLCNLRIEFEGLTTEKAFQIYQIGNQVLSSSIKRDRVEPMVSVTFPEGIGKIGETITLTRPYFADILSPSPDQELMMSATKASADGNDFVTLTDQNGVALNGISDFSTEHRFVLNDYGTYFLAISASDGKGNAASGNLAQSIVVIDDIAPTISLKAGSNASQTVKAGSPFSPLEVVVADNDTPTTDLTIYYTVYDARGMWIAAVKAGEDLTITKAGAYRMYVSVNDESGNLAYLTYPLTVE